MLIAGGTLYLLQLFVSLFLAILFLQSGFDKIVDRQGNLEWLKGHFAKSVGHCKERFLGPPLAVRQSKLPVVYVGAASKPFVGP